MLSQQNALSITCPTAVDSGELLLVLGPESIKPGQFLWPVYLIGSGELLLVLGPAFIQLGAA